MNHATTHPLEQGLLNVWNERDAGQRRVALSQLYAPTICFFERDAVVEGLDAVSHCISRLQRQWPADFVFQFDQRGLASPDLVQLFWTLGPVGGPVAATGTDVAVMENHLIVAVIKNSLIQSLYSFMDSRSAGSGQA